MGFKDVKSAAIKCLKEGAYDHEARVDIDLKYLFEIGVVDTAYLISLIAKTTGDQYQCSPHHKDNTINVYIFRPYKDDFYWYVKFYFVDPDIFLLVSIINRSRVKK